MRAIFTAVFRDAFYRRISSPEVSVALNCVAIYITLPSILEAILCTWIMHAVSKIQISHFTSSFSCTRARPPRRAARSASGKNHGKCCCCCSSAEQGARRRQWPPQDPRRPLSARCALRRSQPVLRATNAPPKRDLGASRWCLALLGCL